VITMSAGAGSCEPQGPAEPIAAEPSETLIRQRPAKSAPVIRASAVQRLFRDNAFDAALALLTVHQRPAPPQSA
jgi:hypothetical protein